MWGLAGSAWLGAAGRACAQDASDPGHEQPLGIDERIRAQAESAPLQLVYSQGADVEAWRRSFRARLDTLLGDSTPPRDFQVVEESRTELDDHTRHEVLLVADGVPAVPVYLLIPRGASGPRPAVLCLHGHGAHGHHPIVGRTDLEGVPKSIESARYDYGLQFVRRGYVVAAPCLTPFGRRLGPNYGSGADPCAVTFVRLQALGQLTITENLRDCRWVLDWLQRRDEVRGDRLGCAGLSYGGRMTMLVSAIDSRIRVAAVSGALNVLQERIRGRYSCGSQVIPGLLQIGDYPEIGGLIAPRPCVWETGSRDGLIVEPWAESFRERLRAVYAAHHAEQQLQFDRFEGGHVWSGQVAYPLFERALA